MVAVGGGLQPWFGLVLLASLTVAARVPPSAVKSRLAPAPVQQCLDKSPLAKLRGGTCVTEGVDSSLFESSRFAALEAWHPVLLALLGTSFGWFMTALGAAAVVIKRLGLPEPIFRKEREPHRQPTAGNPRARAVTPHAATHSAPLLHAPDRANLPAQPSERRCRSAAPPQVERSQRATRQLRV